MLYVARFLYWHGEGAPSGVYGIGGIFIQRRQHSGGLFIQWQLQRQWHFVYVPRYLFWHGSGSSSSGLYGIGRVLTQW